LCDICFKELPFCRTWMMTEKKQIVCPGCIDTARKRGWLLVSI
jgi:hypothetical protein